MGCARWLWVVALLGGSLPALAQEFAPPSVLGCPPSVWPEEAPVGEPPVVQMLLHLSDDGTIDRISEVDGPEPFATAAVEAVGACRFTPAREDGVPVPVQVPFAWRFPPPPEVVDAAPPDAEEPAAGGEVVGTYRRDVSTLRVVDRAMIRDTPGTLGDPIRALQTRAGLARTPFDAGWVLVRGGDFDHTALFLDGAPIPLLFHLGGFTSVLHPELTEEVQFHPGVPPVRYGDALSGAVDVHTRRVGDAPRAQAGVNLVFAHAFGEVPAGDGGVAFAARRSYLDGVLTAALDAERARIAPRFTDAQLKVDQGPTRWTVIALDDRFDAPTSNALEDTVEVAQQGVQLTGTADAGALTLTPRVGWSSRSVQGSYSDERLTELTGSARAEVAGEVETVRLSAGAEAGAHAWSLTVDTVERRLPGVRLEPFVQVEGGRRVRTWVGLRGTALQVGDHLLRTGLSPRAGAAVRVTGRWTISAALARVLRTPRTTLLVGVPEGRYLELEQADTLSVGARYATPALALDVEVWTRAMAHLAGFEWDGSVDGQHGDARGLEAQVEGKRGPVGGALLAQLSRTRRWEDPGDTPELWLLDQPLRLEALGRVETGRGWQVSSRWRYSAGFPTPDVGADGLAPTALDLLRQVREPLDRTQPRLAPYHTLDLRIRRRWERRRWTVDAGLDLQNVYNRRVPEPVITGFGESQYGYGFGLPILPIFGVEGTWTGGRDQVDE